MRPLSHKLLVLATAVSAVASPATAQATIDTVAIQDDQSPQPGLFFKTFKNPAVGDVAGANVGFYATTTRSKCIFKLNPVLNTGSAVACRGGVSPDARSFTSFADPSMNTAADVAWSARVSGSSGVYRGDPTTVDLLGDAVPAPGSGLLNQLSMAQIADSGDLAFKSTISGAAMVGPVPVDQGIFRCSGGDGNCSPGGTGVLTSEVLKADSVPDRAGRQFCDFSGLDISSYGLAFRASTQLDCSDGGESPLVGIFRMPLFGAIETVALSSETSEPFPVPAGTTYSSINSGPTINNSGEVAFGASATGNVGRRALFVCGVGTCPAAPATDAVDTGQTDDGGNVFKSFSAPAISDAGDIAFSAPVRGVPRVTTGVFVRRASADIETVALDEDSVPGLVPAARFTTLPPQPSISSAGRIAFRATVTRSVSPTHRQGIFVDE
jgi:hypothetical protein